MYRDVPPVGVLGFISLFFFKFYFYFPFCFLFFFFNSTLDLQACALWVRDYFSVNRVFCHSIEIIKAST